MADEVKKCAHQGCMCTAAADSKYCSVFCSDADGTTTLQCDCGHAACKQQEL